jgi:uncharacterized RDD family membrane protein YckC
MTEPPESHWSAASTVPRQARGFQGNRAGFVTRAIAVGIDFTLIGVLLLLLYLGWAVLLFAFNPSAAQLPEIPTGLGLITGGGTAWLLFTTAWSTTGRTLGSRIMGIRVVNYQGKVMRVPGAALRAAFCIGFMPGLLWVIISNQNRSLQDTVLRTSVIYDWTKRPPAREEKGEA